MFQVLRLGSTVLSERSLNTPFGASGQGLILDFSMSHVFNADGIPGSKFVNISARRGQLPGKPGTYHPIGIIALH
eukprot:765612-Hanusia_phi.AAC.1